MGGGDEVSAGRDPGLAGVKAAIDHLTEQLTTAIDANTSVAGDILAAIDRLVGATAPPPLVVDALREQEEGRD